MLLIGIIYSCSNEEEPIELDKATMYISNKGGSDTIRVLNYQRVSMSGEAEVHLNDSVFWVRAEQNTVFQDQFEIDGGWFQIVVPYKIPNRIVASVKDNKLAPNDKWSIKVSISNANVFRHIEIKSKESHE